MKPTTVKVPSRLLLDPDLEDSAKLLWMIYQLNATVDSARSTAGALQSLSGLSRTTVLRGLTRLENAGWLAATASSGRASRVAAAAAMPSDILLDRRLGVQAKLVYGSLQLTAGFRGRTGQVTYGALSSLMNLTPKPVRSAVRELQEHGWLQVSRRNQLCPLHFTLKNPIAQLRASDVALATRRLQDSSFLGEALMREYLSLIVDSNEYEDNATPGFLVNPYTDEEMQFDRYYPPRVAFEFNGPQHYSTTALYAKEMDVRKQQGRDLIKLGICLRREITLVVIHPEDLKLQTMRQRVSGLLPLRDLDGHGPLIEYLEHVSRAYRRKAVSTIGPNRKP